MYLVIPLVDFSLQLSWQPFPLPLVPLGPSFVHIFLGRFSPHKAINTCGLSVAEVLVTGPVSRTAEHSVSRLSAFPGALFSLRALMSLTLGSLSTVPISAYLGYFKFPFFTHIPRFPIKWPSIHHQQNSTFSLVILLDHGYRREAKSPKTN